LVQFTRLFAAGTTQKPLFQAGFKAFLDFSPKKLLISVNPGQTSPVTDRPPREWEEIFEITLSQGN
jgi:hypothetical protein